MESQKIISKESYLLIVNNTIKEAIIIANNQGIIIDCNKATEDIFGWKINELVGSSVTKIMPEEYHDSHFIGLKRFVDTGESNLIGKTVDIEGLHKNGYKISIELSLVSILFGEEQLFSAVIRDITHRKANEKQISILNETLKTRIAALEAFKFSLVHDLNAPLRALEGFSEILEQDYSDKLDNNAKDYIHRINISIRRMKQLISDMLRLSKVTQPGQELHREEVNLSDIIRNLLNEHVEYYNENHRICEFLITPKLYGYVDKELFNVALLNLVSNAWKFTAKKEKTIIEFGAQVEDNTIVYYIKDNGVGFDMNKIEKLFKPFSRLHDKKDFDGNGVGLTIVKQILTLHDGKVWAEGKIDQGATFYFTIGNDNVGTN